MEEEQRQQIERQKEQQPDGAAGHIVRRREIPLWGWLAVIGYMLLVDNFMPSGYEGWALVAGWFAASAMCVVNYRSCGRYHCKITGLGFFGVGILAVLDTLGMINTGAWIIWTTLFAVLAVGFGLEYRYNSKSGSRYMFPAIRNANLCQGNDEFCMNNNNNNNDYASLSKYIPGSTLGASTILAVVLHYFFPVTILIPFPYNLLGLLIVGLGVYSAFLS